MLESLSIVLPCYNEAQVLERTVEDALRWGALVTGDLEVIIVNDGSTDQTASLATRLSSSLPQVRVIDHPANKGYGHALRTGFDAASKAWIFYTDADGQFDLTDLPRAVVLLTHSGHSFIAGYRIHRADHALRRGCGRAWTALTGRLVGFEVRDVDCAFKVFPRSLLSQAPLTSGGAFINAELLALAKARGLSVAEVGVRHRRRTTGRPTGGRLPVVARGLWELARWSIARRVAP